MSTPHTLESFEFQHKGQSRTVYFREQAGAPAVLLLQELPGITWHSLTLVDRLYKSGFSVYLPHLFGEVGQQYSVSKSLASICIRREFGLLNRRKSSSFTESIRALACELQSRSGGKVGAIGMCLTGGFVLSLILDDAVAAPVASQPSHLGNIFSASWKQATGLSAEDESEVARCAAEGNKPLMALRFKADPLCPPERFERYREIFGNKFEARELDTPAGHGLLPPHSVLTVDFNPDPQSQSGQVYRDVVGYLHHHLS